MIKNIREYFFSKFSNDFLNTFLNHGFKLISGPLLLFFLPTFITSEVQGYWFSFISLSSLSVLADMGFTIIILQFSAHEYAYLGVKRKLFYSKNKGQEIYIIKLATLFKFILKWSSFLLLFTFPIILLVGFKLFESEVKIIWKFPWILFVFGSALNFFNNVFLSFFEGCDNVSKTQKIRFINSIVYFGILLFSLFMGKGLYALSNAIFISSLITLIISYNIFRFQVNQLIRIFNKNSYAWFKDFWHFFKKYGISASIGYLSVQLYTPLVFKFYGAEESGKVGLTMSLITAIFSVGNIWFQSIAPKFNIMNSQKRWDDLNNSFKQIMKNTVITYSFICICFVIFYLIINDSLFDFVTKRFLPLFSILTLMMHWFIQNFIYGFAFYLRSFKKEPFLNFSIYSLIIFFFLSFIGFKYLKVEYLFCAHLLTSIISLPFAWFIFNKKKELWILNQ